jgi:hypothetical protein
VIGASFSSAEPGLASELLAGAVCADAPVANASNAPGNSVWPSPAAVVTARKWRREASSGLGMTEIIALTAPHQADAASIAFISLPNRAPLQCWDMLSLAHPSKIAFPVKRTKVIGIHVVMRCKIIPEVIQLKQFKDSEFP